MSPEELEAALGDGWRPILWGWWLADSLELRVHPVRDDLAGSEVWWRSRTVPCASPQVAVAVAKGLVVLEQVAAGGEVSCDYDRATEREMAYALGRDEERAAVVAWLAVAEPELAPEIERGEHLPSSRSQERTGGGQ